MTKNKKFSNFRIIAWTCLSVCIIILFVGIGIVIRPLSEKKHTSDATLLTLEIETKKLPVLPPHLHDPHTDSVGYPDHGIPAQSDIITVPEDMWVQSFTVEARNAPYYTIHHIPLFRLDKASTECPNLYPNSTLIHNGGFDTIRVPTVFPPSYGVFLPKGTPLRLLTVFHNPLSEGEIGTTYHDVSAAVILRGERAGPNTKTYKPLERHKIVLEDIPQCQSIHNETFVVPGHQKNFIKKSDPSTDSFNISHYIFPQSGILVNLRGHLHAWDGGKFIDVFLNDTALVRLIPRHTDSGQWSWRSPLFLPFLPIAKGDILSIAATYINPSSKPLVSVMGTLGFYFAPDQ
jgi:hypothetical protein